MTGQQRRRLGVGPAGTAAAAAATSGERLLPVEFAGLVDDQEREQLLDAAASDNPRLSPTGRRGLGRGGGR